MSGTTGFIFSYIIGLVFLIGGLLFLFVLDQNQLLFGIPYILLGVVILLGLHLGRRRRKRQEQEDALLDAKQDPSGGSSSRRMAACPGGVESAACAP